MLASHSMPTAMPVDDFLPLRIGILGIQGAFVEHVAALQRVDPSIVPTIIRGPNLPELDGIIIPGGESTTMTIIAQQTGLFKELEEWVRSGKPTMGTCAGLIMLATSVAGECVREQPSLGGLGCRVYRNFYGTQYESFTALVNACNDEPEDLGVVGFFIRAPLIESVEHGTSIKVLATIKRGETEQIVAIRQNNCLGLSFHPELTDSPAWHKYFVELVHSARGTQS